jgi:hypothetical protein
VSVAPEGGRNRIMIYGPKPGKALGLTVPLPLLGRADEVVE